jgi:hypothetical protein
MSSSPAAHVRFANPIVQSVSRKPTHVEYIHINLLENHTERCVICRPSLNGERHSNCRRGKYYQKLVLQDFVVGKDGHIYSFYNEKDHPVQVEIARHCWAVYAILQQVDRRPIREYTRLITALTM